VAEGTARTFADLSGDAIAERARSRATAREELAEPPPATVPLLLAPEAAAVLVGRFGEGLGARAFEEGRLLSREDLGREVAAAQVTLRDDGSAPHGLPFPFDVLGWLSRPVVHVAAGRLQFPAVDARLGAALGLPATSQAVAEDESCPRHLFLDPGGTTEEDLLAAAAGGLWIGGLEAVGDAGGRFRALARGVRAIEGGGLGRAVAPLLWEDDLLRVFREVLTLGSRPVPVALDAELFAAASAPALAVAAGGRLGPAPSGPGS
jgi:predicted Zn-dependent protease